jgi:chromate transporter
MTTRPDYGPPPIGRTALFLKFLRFGCFAFGGPVAQIAMIRQALVDDERWMSSARFNRLLAVMQILPGPEAHELCVHMGMAARGRIGGLLAGLGFMAPGFLLMLLAGWLYRDWIGHAAWAAPVLFGVQLIVLAIIARAVQRIGGHILHDPLLWALAGGAFVATLLSVPFWIPLLVSGLVYHFREKPSVALIIAALGVAAAYGLHPGAPVARTPSEIAVVPPDDWLLFVAGLKGGLLTFGGAYTAIPYVRDDTVGRHWLSDAAFLDGVALAGVLPAPLVIFATFVGYVAGGWIGAVAITVGMFLPAFAFSMLFYDRLEAVVENAALHHILSGVAGGVVGIIAATLVQLGWAAFGRVTHIEAAILIIVIGLIIGWRLKGRWVMPITIMVGALAGGLLRP